MQPFHFTSIDMLSYICEISPPSKRGPLASSVQLLICAGIMIGYFVSYGTVNIPSSLSWRLPLALQSAIAASAACASQFYLPASPRWLAHKGRKEEASAVWDLLGVSAAEREKDLLENPVNEMNELNELPAVQTTALDTGFIARLRRNSRKTSSMFGKDSRKQMMLGVFMMSMQQLSGIDGVLYVRTPRASQHPTANTLPVRAAPLPTGWHQFRTSILPRLWRLRYPNLCLNHPSHPAL